MRKRSEGILDICGDNHVTTMTIATIVLGEHLGLGGTTSDLDILQGD